MPPVPTESPPPFGGQGALSGPRITIAIASIGRSSLERTLTSFTRLRPDPQRQLRVIVADDSQDGAARARILDLKLPDLDITCLTVGAGNISVARNALLDAAEGDFLIFIDDDEWVEEDWLDRLLDCQREFSAHVVIGPVLPVYPPEAPAWMQKARPHYVPWGERGKRLLTGRGGNTLVDLPLIRKLGLRFNPALGKTGGEDTDFFSRAAARGAVIIATDDAIVREEVPPSRLSTRYILRRALRAGQSYAESRKVDHPTLGWKSLFLINASLKVCVAFVLWLVLRPFDRAQSFLMLRKICLNLGKLRSALGLPLPDLY